MARKLVTFDTGRLSRKERKILEEIHAEQRQDRQEVAERIVEALPGQEALSRLLSVLSPETKLPRHVGTGWEFAALNPFAASDIPQVEGPVIGLERLSGGTPFRFHPWNLYLAGIVSSPNLLVKGSLRRGKSYAIKRLVTLMALYGVFSINTSDVKGEHGVVADALGGDTFRVGAFGTDVRVNPLQASERHHGETVEEHAQRMLASRQNVLLMIAGLLNGDGIPLTAVQKAILSWALDEVIRETNDHPTIRKVLAKIASPDLATARGGGFDAAAARDLLYLFDPMISGNLRGMFEDESSIKFNPVSPYTVFDTFAMEKRGDLALAITQTITNSWVQNTVSNKGAGRRHMLIREEGWRDMKTLQALESHELQLKLSGEYGITMVMIVHEDGDFDTGGEQERQLAQKLLRGYANSITFYQNEKTLQRAVQTGTMTRGEADIVKSFGRGEFLLKAGERAYVIDSRPTSTAWERALFDTDKAMDVRKEAHQQHDAGKAA